MRHTAAAHSGQIYVPVVNWALLIGCIVIIVAFQSQFLRCVLRG
jgi:KUP system potassium uptake protein